MTPEQALSALAQMAAMAHATKQDHLVAEQAVAVLDALVKAQIAPNGAEDAKVSPEVS